MATFMSQSDIVPKQYRGKPADILVAIQYGMELGFAPMQALQSIAVINGRPSIFGDGFMALIIASPLCREHEEYYEVDGQRVDTITVEDLKKDDTTGVCTFWRQGKTIPTTRRFSVGHAKKAALWGKEGPWTNYPDRMLLMRARGFAGRDAFPDLLRGIKTAEEAIDNGADEPIDTVPIQPRRLSEASTPPQRVSDAGAPPAGAPHAGKSSASSDGDSSATGTPAVNGGSAIVAKEARGLKVVATKFVRPKTGEPYFEVTMRGDQTGDIVFLTRDEAVYKEAASFEGTDHLVLASYHEAKKEQSKVLVLDALAIFEGRGELFA